MTLVDTFAEQWKSRMNSWKLIPASSASECDVTVIVATVAGDDFRDAVDNLWDLEKAEISGSSFPFKSGPVCFAR